MDRLPRELQELIDAADAGERQAEALVADLPEDEVNWQAAAGRSWSIAQCLDHLTMMTPFYLAPFHERVAAARRRGVGPFRGLHPTAIGRWFIRELEPPVRRKMRSPKAGVPRSTLPLDGLVDAFKASHEPYRQLIHAAAHVDTDRVTGLNPFLHVVPMRISTVLLIIRAHDRRHLWQAANVKRALRAGRTTAVEE